MTDSDTVLAASRRAFVGFVEQCRIDASTYRLTPLADPSPYARCFAVFCQHLALEPFSASAQDALANAIRRDVRAYRMQNIDPRGKAFRQLLSFSLSALHILGVLRDDPLAELVTEQIPTDVRSDLDRYACLTGEPGSGNQAMFTAIFLLHGRDYLAVDTGRRIEAWVELHLARMNRFGFWGSDAGMTHLQFQNGYHQHEILEYLQVRNPRQSECLLAISRLADADGHFAPYPGGGGCYDYDAVFLLTPHGTLPSQEVDRLLDRTFRTLIEEQRPDGGFAESLSVRPRTARTVSRTLTHIAQGGGAPIVAERLRYGLTLQRPKHNRIHTHWSAYSRRWNESDLWDSWFRMLALARIQVARHGNRASDWGFIGYPGIGFHPSARLGWPSA
jgi:hypothetical protein